MKYKLKDERATKAFASALAKNLSAGDTLALIGDLASGKTTISQQIGKELGVQRAMPSPTFALVNQYNLAQGKLIHSDVYRLSSEDELWEIGFEEYFTADNIILIEWADLIMPFIQEHSQNLIIVKLEHLIDGRLAEVISDRALNLTVEGEVEEIDTSNRCHQ